MDSRLVPCRSFSLVVQLYLVGGVQNEVQLIWYCHPCIIRSRARLSRKSTSKNGEIGGRSPRIDDRGSFPPPALPTVAQLVSEGAFRYIGEPRGPFPRRYIKLRRLQIIMAPKPRLWKQNWTPCALLYHSSLRSLSVELNNSAVRCRGGRSHAKSPRSIHAWSGPARILLMPLRVPSC